MRGGKVGRISRVVLKWLIPAQKGRSCGKRTGRILDLPHNAGYRAREMLERTKRTDFAHDVTPLTKNVHGEDDACDFPAQCGLRQNILMIPKS
jgi:hypothetical protein